MNRKTILAASSAVALVSATAMPLIAQAAPAPEAALHTQSATAKAAATTQATDAPARSTVFGQFAFTQDAVTPVSQLAGAFSKSAAVLCQSLPQYGCQECVNQLILSAPGSPEVQAAVQELAQREGGASFTMACACATNAPGGGAMANAEAQGVLLKSLAALMGA